MHEQLKLLTCKTPTQEEVVARDMLCGRCSPYRDENKTQRTPYVTIIIIALNVLAWLVVERAGAPVALAGLRSSW